MRTIQDYANEGYYIEIAVTFRYGKPMWSYRIYTAAGEKISDNYNDPSSYHENYDVVLERAEDELRELLPNGYTCPEIENIKELTEDFVNGTTR